MQQVSNPSGAAGGSLVAEEVQLLAALTRFLEGPEAALIVAQLWLTVLPLAQQVLAALPAGSKLLMATLGALCAALSRSLELSRGRSTRPTSCSTRRPSC